MPKFVANRINGIYIITDGRYAGKDGHVTIAQAAVRAGTPCLQLRAPELSDRNLLEVAKEIAQLTRNTGTLFIVNNRQILHLRPALMEFTWVRMMRLVRTHEGF